MHYSGYRLTASVSTWVRDYAHVRVNQWPMACSHIDQFVTNEARHLRLRLHGERYLNAGSISVCTARNISSACRNFRDTSQSMPSMVKILHDRYQRLADKKYRETVFDVDLWADPISCQPQPICCWSQIPLRRLCDWQSPRLKLTH